MRNYVIGENPTEFKAVEIYDWSDCIGAAHVYGLEGNEESTVVFFSEFEDDPTASFTMKHGFERWDVDRARSVRVSPDVTVTFEGSGDQNGEASEIY